MDDVKDVVDVPELKEELIEELGSKAEPPVNPQAAMESTLNQGMTRLVEMAVRLASLERVLVEENVITQDKLVSMNKKVGDEFLQQLKANINK